MPFVENIKGGVRSRSENVFRKKCPVKRNTFRGKIVRSREDGVGGENWETRRGRSRAGLLRSPRDLHLDLATFGARQSLRNSTPLLALLGTALATLGHIPPKEPWNGQALQVRYQGAHNGASLLHRPRSLCPLCCRKDFFYIFFHIFRIFLLDFQGEIG